MCDFFFVKNVNYIGNIILAICNIPTYTRCENLLETIRYEKYWEKQSETEMFFSMKRWSFGSKLPMF